MSSFDIVSTLNLSEVDNAINQAGKELVQRYDFRGTKTTVRREEKVVTIESSDEYKVKAAYDVLQSKLVRRNVSLKCLKTHDVEPAAKGRAKQRIDLLEGIDQDNARKIIKKAKDLKLKIQTSIQGEQVRVTGKKKDELQSVIQAVKAMDFPLPLQFVNFRD